MKKFIEFTHSSVGFASVHVYKVDSLGDKKQIGVVNLIRGDISVDAISDLARDDLEILSLISRNVSVFEKLLGASNSNQRRLTIEEIYE